MGRYQVARDAEAKVAEKTAFEDHA